MQVFHSKKVYSTLRSTYCATDVGSFRGKIILKDPSLLYVNALNYAIKFTGCTLKFICNAQLVYYHSRVIKFCNFICLPSYSLFATDLLG